MKNIAFVLLAGVAGVCANVAHAASPTCVSPEQKISWPTANPVWEFCYTAYNQSAGPRGSGLDLRNVHYNGKLVLKEAHAPMLFAEYTTSTCYRDWKDVSTPILAETAVRIARRRIVPLVLEPQQHLLRGFAMHALGQRDFEQRERVLARGPV